MSIDQDLDASIVHADLRSIGFQLLLCNLGVFLVLSNGTLQGILFFFCFSVFQCECLLVTFGELG